MARHVKISIVIVAIFFIAGLSIELSQTFSEEAEYGEMDLAWIEYRNKNYQQSFSLFMSLAEAGNADAMYIIGKMYQAGQGIPQDNPKALLWVEKSARNGNHQAQTELASFYSKGIGTDKNLVLAYAWYGFAVLNGSKTSIKNKTQIRKQLSKDELKDGESLLDLLTINHSRIEQKECIGALGGAWQACNRKYNNKCRYLGVEDRPRCGILVTE